MNPYLDAVHAALPRLLASFDRDALRASRGLGDRNAWAWKTIDFFNATPQGAVHGLARLVAADLLPQGMCAEPVMARIEEAVDALARITRGDGSLEEAFPYEGSFCVTALVAYDLLVAREQLGAHWSARAQRCLARVEPLIGYLLRADETHGAISNHILTAVAALCAWHDAVPGAASSAPRRCWRASRPGNRRKAGGANTMAPMPAIKVSPPATWPTSIGVARTGSLRESRGSFAGFSRATAPIATALSAAFTAVATRAS